MGQRIPAAPAPGGAPGPTPGPAGAEAAGAAPEGGGDELSSLIQNLASGMQMLTETVQATGIRPDIAERMAALQQEFSSLMDEISGAGGQEAAPAGQGVASPEAGVAAAVPAGPATR